MLLEDLQSAYKQAMIDKNPLAKEAINSTIAQIKNKKIELQRDPSEEEIQKVIQKEVKVRKEGAGFFQQAGKLDTYAEEMEKVAILEGFLPTLLSEDELYALVEQYITSLAITDLSKQRGVLTGALMKEYGASIDGALLNKIISTKL